MDPTAPNNPDNQNPPAPPNPIQPGQFVVAGEDAPPAANPQITAQPAPTPQAPQPTMNLAQDKAAPTQVFPNAPVGPTAVQPDPTPFTSPPGATPNLAGVPPTGAAAPKSRNKMLIILIALIVLVAIIGAVVYFVVLPKAKTGTKPTTDTQVDEPSPSPTRTDGGFGTLPEASGSTALPSPTPSGLPASSTTNPGP